MFVGRLIADFRKNDRENKERRGYCSHRLPISFHDPCGFALSLFSDAIKEQGIQGERWSDVDSCMVVTNIEILWSFFFFFGVFS